jgi:hypothetical protein
VRRSELVLWHLPLPVVLQQAFLFKFGDVNKAVLLVLSWTYGYLLLPKIKMLLVGRVSSAFLYLSAVICFQPVSWN